MKIALVGYGKMGKAIENIALERGYEIVATIQLDSGPDEWERALKADVAIEFTSPESAAKNIQWCLENCIPVVVGSTGWYEHYDDIILLCNQKEGAMLTATNFSIGVNLFFALNEYLAQLMNAHTDYDANITEVHHTEKKDAPSGTAITLATQLIAQLKRKKTWRLADEQHQDYSPSTLPIFAIREDEVPGTHVITYTSAIDEIEIKHTAHSRLGFALGALAAAEWLVGKKGVFTMKDVIKL